jgi:hypothetical protein
MITWFQVGYFIATQNIEVLIRSLGLKEDQIGDVLSGYHFGYLTQYPDYD